MEQFIKTLTPKQRALVEIAQETGYLCLDDFRKMYVNKECRVRAISVLVMTGLIKPVDGRTHRWECNSIQVTEKDRQMTIVMEDTQ